MNGLISYTERDVDLLARLMRAEALGEGELGMLMVGNVIVNRALVDCLDFGNVRSISQVAYQSPGGFSGVYSPLFQSAATEREKELARRVLRGEYYYPATNALWFYAPKKGEACVQLWYNQRLAGRYKNHCFYEPNPSVCPNLY